MKRLARLVAAVAAVAVSFLPARAADPAPPAGGPPAEVVFARVTLAGINRTDTALVKAGFAGAGDLLAEKLAFLPFIPQDGMSREAPVSVFFVGSDTVAKQNAAGFVLPLRPGTVPLADFKKDGNFQPVPGHDDTILLQGTPFRRTANYLMFGGTPGTITQAHEDALAAVVRDPDVLLRADVDIALIRRAAPKAYAEFFDQMQKQQAAAGGPADPAKSHAEKAGQEWVNKYLRDGLDHLSYVIKADGNDAAMDVTVGPVKVTPGPATWGKPAFPAGVIGRLDYAHPARDAAPAAVEGLTALLRLGGGGNIPDGVAEADVRELFDALADLMIGDAVSVGVRPADKAFVAYAVIQRDQPKDLNRQLDRIVAVGEKIEKQVAATRPAGAKREGSFARSTYKDDAGATVTRLAVTGKDGTTAYIDLLPQGTRLLATIGTTSDHNVSALAGTKFEGKITDLIEAEIDLPALAKVIESMPNAPAGDQAKLLHEALKDGKAKFGVKVDGKALTLKYRVPLKAIGSMMNAAAGR